MITFVRTTSIAPGKNAEALAFAHAAIRLIKDKFGITVGLNMPIGGNPNRLAYVVTYANLTELESAMGRLVADTDYQKMLAANAQTFLPGSVHDEIWRSVP